MYPISIDMEFTISIDVKLLNLSRVLKTGKLKCRQLSERC